MTRKNGFSLACLLFLTLVIAGCQISPRRTLGGTSTTSPTPTPSPTPVATPTPIPTPTPVPTPTPTGKLYVTSGSQNSIVRFDNAFTATGNVAPAANVSGVATGLSLPVYLALDSTADRLFVASRSNASIVIFDQASTKTGNVAPNRVISGAATNLGTPTDVSLDKSRDLIYVADDLDVFVFNAASTANGNVAVSRDIQVGFVVSAVLIDSAADRLFVADPTGNTIDVFDSASTLTGAVTPSRQISGAATGLGHPAGLRIDTLGRLIVSNSSPASITVYNAASASGNVAPSATISGTNTGLVTPNQIDFDPTGSGTLYVADPGAGNIAIFGSFSTASGNIAPTRTISGALTTLSATGLNSGVAVDATR